MSRADAVDTIASKRPIVIGFAVGDALAIAESTNMAGLAGAGAGAPPGRLGAIDGGDIPEEATTGSPAVEALPAATVHKLNEIRQDMQQRAPNAYSSLVALRVREPRKCYKMVSVRRNRTRACIGSLSARVPPRVHRSTRSSRRSTRTCSHRFARIPGRWSTRCSRAPSPRRARRLLWHSASSLPPGGGLPFLPPFAHTTTTHPPTLSPFPARL